MKYLFFLLFLSSSLSFGQETQEPISHKFYAQPVLVFCKEARVMGGGVGYRFHQDQHGCDISLNAIEFQICSSKGLFPFLKASYLIYPQGEGFYFGVGGNLGFFGLLSSIGLEMPFYDMFIFAQIDMTYPSALTFPLGTASLGIGF